MDSVFLRRVVLQNYRSIAGCDVRLGPLTFLVGPNGSGKSNFLDALRFVADSLQTTLDHALRSRGGINEVRRRSKGHPTNFGCRLEARLPGQAFAVLSFKIGALKHGGFTVQDEYCETYEPQRGRSSYRVQEGKIVESTMKVAPPAVRDRLYLVAASGLPEFRPLYDRLSGMGFYNLNPDRIRDLQQPDEGALLKRDGSNLASVLAALASESSAMKERVEEYLAAVVPGITAVNSKTIGPKETVEFRQEVAGSVDPWRFTAVNMSDGTLRALGVLVALFQGANGRGSVPLVGIEEPEAALHPAAAGGLLDSLVEASGFTQVIVTSHSSDLLDDPKIDTASLLAVTQEQGITRIGPVDELGRGAVRDQLFTPGELLRQNCLVPDPAALADPEEAQRSLFEELREAG